MAGGTVVVDVVTWPLVRLLSGRVPPPDPSAEPAIIMRTTATHTPT